MIFNIKKFFERVIVDVDRQFRQKRYRNSVSEKITERNNNATPASHF